MRRVDKTQAILDRARELQDPQSELSLLRACIGFPKIAFALRTCPPENIQGAIAKFDKVIRTALSFIIGLDR